ncbi:MAG: TonB-dependent receptor plug domain-containing protein [Polyangiales bacterium]
MTFKIRLGVVAALALCVPFGAPSGVRALDGGVPLRAADPRTSTEVVEAPDASTPVVGAAGLDAGLAREPLSVLAPPPREGAIDVEVRTRSRADKLRRSALAVGVLELREAKRGAQDLGEVLARAEGVGVRRAGGLGSDQRLSLAGLEGEQVRVFLDGLPLELSGYPFGLANVPVNALERVEIYRGVVPIQLGADALGGAVSLVGSTPRAGVHAVGSYQGGSFDTHRGTAEVSVMRGGLFARAFGFADYTENDYEVTVDEAKPDGTPYVARVKRFHDAYRAEGGHLTLGAVDQPWARRLLVRAFLTDYRKEVQNNVLMTRPYGDATTGGLSTGATVSYQHQPTEHLSLDASGGYTHSITRMHDLTTCIYDWFGVCKQGQLHGELPGGPKNVRQTQHAVYARATARHELPHGQAVSLSLAPTYYQRGGNDRYEPRPGARDPLDVDRRLSNVVVGAEYALAAFDDKLEATAFGKAYLQWLRSEELLRDGETSVQRDRSSRRLGGGATARYTFIEPLWLKLSYEYATRLPTVDEVLGDAVTIEPNLMLAPERSHNGNVTLATELNTGAGRLTGEGSAFLRDADQLIYLTGVDVFRHQNVARARSMGGMASASWTSPGQWLSLGGNATYQAFRNETSEGDLARFKGDRMPNRPYLFANGSARGQVRNLLDSNDALSLTFFTRYTHAFFRGWESAGRRDTKDRIPSQLVHSLTLTYAVQRTRSRALSTSVEVQNLTNARVFDFFGVEKPGRALFAKILAEL